MSENDLIIRLAVSLGLGLLVGLQREYDGQPMAGIRTFGIITLMGTITGLITGHVESGWIIASGALVVAIIFAAPNLMERKEPSVRVPAGADQTIAKMDLPITRSISAMTPLSFSGCCTS